MSLLISSSTADIMNSRPATELVSSLKKQLDSRMTKMMSDELLAMLCAFRNQLKDEIGHEAETTKTLDAITLQLDSACRPADLIAACGTFQQLVTVHFQKRGSTCSVETLCTAFREKLLQRTLKMAEEQLHEEGAILPQVRFTILASGSCGRRELSLNGGSSFFMIYDGSGKQCDEYFSELAARMVATLKDCCIRIESHYSCIADQFWHGSIFSWQRMIEEHLQPPTSPHWLSMPVLPSLATNPYPIPQEEVEFARMIETLADLRPIAGDENLAATLTDHAALRLTAELKSDPFRHLAKRIATMPVARSIFGWFRVIRSGEHRGEFNLEQLALTPLLMTVRFMALRKGILGTGTSERIKSLCRGRQLDVELAERLLSACHEFAVHRIKLEISRNSGLEDLFFNPEELVDGEKERFKLGLEAVVNLQKLLYQELTETA